MQTYTYEEAFQLALEYFAGDELAAKVFLDKYTLRDNQQNLLEATPMHMHRRIASEFARIEKKKFSNPMSEEQIFGLLDGFKYIIPQGSPMFGIGNNYQLISLSNCYVVDSPKDSYGGIMKIDEELAQISKRRGGVGVDISTLRPAGTSVKNAARTSTGIGSWMERYSNTIREVGQSGRRGALMLTVDVAHKDIENFITIKNDDTKVTGANISVRLSNEFLDAVKKCDKFRLRFPVDAPPSDNDTWVDAKDLWKKIIHNSWLRAEPGLLFWDRITGHNMVDCYKEFGFETVSTNPCVTGDTVIVTDRGPMIIMDAISIVVNGEKLSVLCYDTENGVSEFQEIEAGALTRRNADVIKLELENGEEIKLTPDHKVYTENRGWVKAADLTEEDILISI